MTKRDRAAVGVHLLWVRAHVARPGENDGRESFVDLERIDGAHAQPGPRKQFSRRWNDRGQHEDWIVSGDREMRDRGPRLQSEPASKTFLGDECRRGAVGDLTRIA